MALNRGLQDPNRNPSLIGLSNADGLTIIEAWLDPTTHRLLADVTGSVGHGKAIKTATGSTNSSGDNTIVSGVSSKRIKVIAFSLFSASTTSNTLTFKDNTAGTSIWTAILQAPAASTVMGANLATQAPSFLFASTAGNPLVLNLSAAVSVTYSITYFDDDAS